MKIANDTVVSLTYILKADNAEGEIIQVADQQNPLTFLYGQGQLLPAFEEKLMGLETGSSYAFTLSPEEGYGEFDPEAIVDLDISIFRQSPEGESALFEGNIVPMMDQQGNRYEGRIMRINEDSVNMDFNHPLAGKSLYFTGTILEVRNATAEELAHGHVHGPHGHHH